MQIMAHVARPNGHRRAPWLVWLMAGILVAFDLGHSPSVEAPLEARLALLGFGLAIVGVLAQDLWGRYPLTQRFARIAVRLFGLCGAGGALALLLGVGGSRSGAERLEAGVASAMAFLEPCVSLAMAGALVVGLLRLVAGGWFAMRRPASLRSAERAQAPGEGGPVARR